MEVSLGVPYLFDQRIGYWTGEVDVEALQRALAAVPQGPEVEREVAGDLVVLRGPDVAVLAEAVLLREAGLI